MVIGNNPFEVFHLKNWPHLGSQKICWTYQQKWLSLQLHCLQKVPVPWTLSCLAPTHKLVYEYTKIVLYLNSRIFEKLFNRTCSNLSFGIRAKPFSDLLSYNLTRWPHEISFPLHWYRYITWYWNVVFIYPQFSHQAFLTVLIRWGGSDIKYTYLSLLYSLDTQ